MAEGPAIVHGARENGDGRKRWGRIQRGGGRPGVGGGGQERPRRVSVREGRPAAELGEPPRLRLLFSKYHMTAPMCCRLAQVNSRPRKPA